MKERCKAMKKYDYLVIGSGLYGSIFAHEAKEKGKKVLVIDKRPTIAGNIYTEKQEGINVHKYGAHIFHTNNKKVWSYITQFAEFNRFTNSPVANYKGELYSMPFNMYTFNKMWGVVTPEEATAKIEEQKREITGKPKNLEEQAISLVGRDIYEKLVKGYTEKQWGRDCKELPAFIIKRLPVRLTFDNNYFNALYQGIPIGGYTKMIEKILDGIEVRLNTDYLENKEELDSLAEKIVYTGPIDAYFGYKLGTLEYRSVRFENETLDIPNFQGNAAVNYTDRETPWTRIIEHKWFEFGKDENGNERYNIVDGQQRTITFSLLLYALYKATGETITIDFLGQQVFNNEYSRRNVPNNYNAFRRRVGAKGEADDKMDHDRNIKQLRKYIEDQCELIVVITDDLSEAFQFFDSQNARGKALYPHDLLKAYHLREMAGMDDAKTEKIVEEWEKIPQHDLAVFFGDYLYRIKEWINGNWTYKLSEHNIFKFKGITRTARTPYAQFYKGAYSYAEFVNSSAMPFVSGTREVNAFQLNTPIIAGKPFFDYTKHYYEILKDIQDNSQYEGFYIKGDVIVKTLDCYFNRGTGNRIIRLLFDTALLLYVDRFCPATFPTKVDIELFEQFVTFAFIWAYSLRAQYDNLGWQSAQNYVLENSDKVNSLNIYKLITDSDTPISLLSMMADKLSPLSQYELSNRLKKSLANEETGINKKDGDEVFVNYLHYFESNQFYTK